MQTMPMVLLALSLLAGLPAVEIALILIAEYAFPFSPFDLVYRVRICSAGALTNGIIWAVKTDNKARWGFMIFSLLFLRQALRRSLADSLEAIAHFSFAATSWLLSSLLAVARRIFARIPWGTPSCASLRSRLSFGLVRSPSFLSPNPKLSRCIRSLPSRLSSSA